eukprot:TRINITY_DN2925_c0_g3_i1.p1 TRINITY_DN2925_c0_g3~~TRINITY_DN2925_c0_g3_i1.p1  ORF type:complete len:622 (+),score=120.63 TRINITY_DN2925_c0_g3_i1:1848-3713(+)
MLRMRAGDRFTLFERLVDFGTKRVSDNIASFDEQLASAVPSAGRLFESVVLDSAAVAPATQSYQQIQAAMPSIRRVYEDYANLHPDADGAQLNILRSQSAALQSVLQHRVTVVWGPPGNGKTHCLALIVLRLIEAMATVSKTAPAFRVLMTAVTHSAIDNFLQRVALLLRLLPLPGQEEHVAWLRQVCVRKIDAAGETVLFPPTAPGQTTCACKSGCANKRCSCRKADRHCSPGCQCAACANGKQPIMFEIVGCTVWRAYKLRPEAKTTTGHTELFDVLIIDEASQLSVADASLPFACLRAAPEPKIIVAGDALQMPPILKGRYDEDPMRLCGSVLDCLMRGPDGRPVTARELSRQGGVVPHVVVLRENKRMLGPLLRFTERLYGGNFTQNFRGRPLLLDQDARLEDIAPAVRQLLLGVGGHNLASIRLDLEPGLAAACPAERLLRLEAAAVAETVRALLQYVSWEDHPPGRSKIFVVTPHRNQRSAINQLLGRAIDAADGIRVDTVERMQGDEAPVVLVCYGFLDRAQLERETDFLFNLNRINVSISRAQRLCILVASRWIIEPSVSFLVSDAHREAYSHLVAFWNQSAQFVWNLELGKESAAVPLDTELTTKLETLALS